MDTEFIRGLMTDSMQLTVMISLPILLVALVVGLIISILQATTSIQEQTLTFVPKLIIIALILLVAGTWMMTLMDDFFKMIFDRIANL